jgi:hypothetical protein
MIYKLIQENSLLKKLRVGAHNPLENLLAQIVDIIPNSVSKDSFRDIFRKISQLPEIQSFKGILEPKNILESFEKHEGSRTDEVEIGNILVKKFTGSDIGKMIYRNSKVMGKLFKSYDFKSLFTLFKTQVEASKTFGHGKASLVKLESWLKEQMFPKLLNLGGLLNLRPTKDTLSRLGKSWMEHQ